MDPLARDYLLAGARRWASSGRHRRLLLRSADIAAEAHERGASAAQLAAEAAALRERAAADPTRQRRLWLDRQLVALETLARRLAGEQLDYLDEVERCFDARPDHAISGLRSRSRKLDELLPPGDEPARAR